MRLVEARARLERPTSSAGSSHIVHYRLETSIKALFAMMPRPVPARQGSPGWTFLAKRFSASCPSPARPGSPEGLAENRGSPSTPPGADASCASRAPNRNRLRVRPPTQSDGPPSASPRSVPASPRGWGDAAACSWKNATGFFAASVSTAASISLHSQQRGASRLESRRLFGFLCTKKVEKHLKLHVHPNNMGPSDISNLVRLAAAKKVNDGALWSAIKRRVEFLKPVLSPKAIALIANGFARAQKRDFDLFLGLAEQSVQRLEDFETHDAALFLNALARLELQYSQLLDLFARHLQEKDSRLVYEEQHLALIINAYAKLCPPGSFPALFVTLGRRAQRQAAEFTPQGLANVVNGYYRLGHRDDALMAALAPEVLRQAGRLEAQHVANILQGFAWHRGLLGTGSTTSAARRQMSPHDEVLSTLAQLIPRLQQRLGPVEVAACASALASAAIEDRAAVKALSNVITELCDSFRPDQLALALYSLSKVKHVPPDYLQRLTPAITRRLNQFDDQSLVMLLQACSRARLPDRSLFESLSKRLEPQFIKQLPLQAVVMTLYALASVGLRSPVTEALLDRFVDSACPTEDSSNSMRAWREAASNTLPRCGLSNSADAHVSVSAGHLRVDGDLAHSAPQSATHRSTGDRSPERAEAGENQSTGEGSADIAPSVSDGLSTRGSAAWPAPPSLSGDSASESARERPASVVPTSSLPIAYAGSVMMSLLKLNAGDRADILRLVADVVAGAPVGSLTPQQLTNVAHCFAHFASPAAPDGARVASLGKADGVKTPFLPAPLCLDVLVAHALSQLAQFSPQLLGSLSLSLTTLSRQLPAVKDATEKWFDAVERERLPLALDRSSPHVVTSFFAASATLRRPPPPETLGPLVGKITLFLHKLNTASFLQILASTAALLDAVVAADLRCRQDGFLAASHGLLSSPHAGASLAPPQMLQVQQAFLTDLLTALQEQLLNRVASIDTAALFATAQILAALPPRALRHFAGRSATPGLGLAGAAGTSAPSSSTSPYVSVSGGAVAEDSPGCPSWPFSSVSLRMFQPFDLLTPQSLNFLQARAVPFPSPCQEAETMLDYWRQRVREASPRDAVASLSVEGGGAGVSPAHKGAPAGNMLVREATGNCLRRPAKSDDAGRGEQMAQSTSSLHRFSRAADFLVNEQKFWQLAAEDERARTPGRASLGRGHEEALDLTPRDLVGRLLRYSATKKRLAVRSAQEREGAGAPSAAADAASLTLPGAAGVEAALGFVSTVLANIVSTIRRYGALFHPLLLAAATRAAGEANVQDPMFYSMAVSRISSMGSADYTASPTPATADSSVEGSRGSSGSATDPPALPALALVDFFEGLADASYKLAGESAGLRALLAASLDRIASSPSLSARVLSSLRRLDVLEETVLLRILGCQTLLLQRRLAQLRASLLDLPFRPSSSSSPPPEASCLTLEPFLKVFSAPVFTPAAARHLARLEPASVRMRRGHPLRRDRGDSASRNVSKIEGGGDASDNAGGRDGAASTLAALRGNDSAAVAPADAYISSVDFLAALLSWVHLACEDGAVDVIQDVQGSPGIMSGCVRPPTRPSSGELAVEDSSFSVCQRARRTGSEASSPPLLGQAASAFEGTSASGALPHSVRIVLSASPLVDTMQALAALPAAAVSPLHFHGAASCGELLLRASYFTWPASSGAAEGSPPSHLSTLATGLRALGQLAALPAVQTHVLQPSGAGAAPLASHRKEFMGDKASPAAVRVSHCRSDIACLVRAALKCPKDEVAEAEARAANVQFAKSLRPQLNLLEYLCASRAFPRASDQRTASSSDDARVQPPLHPKTVDEGVSGVTQTPNASRVEDSAPSCGKFCIDEEAWNTLEHNGIIRLRGAGDKLLMKIEELMQTSNRAKRVPKLSDSISVAFWCCMRLLSFSNLDSRRWHKVPSMQGELPAGRETELASAEAEERCRVVLTRTLLALGAVVDKGRAGTRMQYLGADERERVLLMIRGEDRKLLTIVHSFLRLDEAHLYADLPPHVRSILEAISTSGARQ
ncbi:hypothetical protein BESB_043270 [Besnoitia besnoiti]|uniref:RAP domain-containing protein n=1 Tax=Besnoitia besnoiti TaxID=94643 RepID=A0A2A9MDQ8_BESBE|nr:hypothetical protein BESB_043270 [Besnoitia besnoiti]PFH36135.1 hypothetical protein BESB_043270 [Besnoitia besnoiti]